MTDMTPGDPLGGSDGGYGTGPVPPGAFAQRAEQPMAPAPGSYRLAEWWRRALAAVIDGAIIAAVTIGVLFVATAVGLSVDSSGGGLAFVLFFVFVAFVAAIAALIYQPLIMWKTNGQTVGKMATGIRVIRTNGQRMELGAAVLREVLIKSLLLGVIASFTFFIVYLVDWLWPLWDDENRALHDFLAQTRVVMA